MAKSEIETQTDTFNTVDVEVQTDDYTDFEVLNPNDSKERQSNDFVCFVREKWKESYPFIHCEREFLEKHFYSAQLNNPLLDFTRRQYYRVGSTRGKQWIQYQLFAHMERGKA